MLNYAFLVFFWGIIIGLTYVFLAPYYFFLGNGPWAGSCGDDLYVGFVLGRWNQGKKLNQKIKTFG